jgi:hypothetical protein
VPLSYDKEPRSAEELAAENEKLRRELLRRRTGPSTWPAVVALLVHIVVRPFFDPWLNAASDAKVTAAVVILAVPVVFAVIVLVRAITHNPGS